MAGPSGAASRSRSHADERELALRAAAGDRTAQRDVLVGQRATVHRTLFRILGSNRDIEDLMQDTFIEVFRGLGRFRGDSSLGRWCSIIATRVAWAHLDRRRNAAAVQSLELVEEPACESPDAQREVVAREAARRLYAALDKLDPALRIAFALAVIDDRPIAEVASLTGASKVATKTRVWRARRELFRRAQRDELLAAYLTDLEARDE